MMIKKIFYSLAVFVFIAACTEQNSNTQAALKTIDKTWLDSIIKASDSSYKKPYKRTDFVTAEFYINKKDSSVCQVMKDSADAIRQIIITRKNSSVFFAQYYSNGQLQADFKFDEYGQFHGHATFYRVTGQMESNGNYIHGFKTGEWKSFNEQGRLISTTAYDSTGKMIGETRIN